MTNKFKAIIPITIFLLAIFSSLKAEPGLAIGDEAKIEDIVKKVYPSVVKVEARNLIRKFATGVVIDKDGYVVTTALISPRDEKISVISNEGKRINAKFLGMDPETHLALLQAEDKNLPPIDVGNTKELSPGSWIALVSISPENTPFITQGLVSSISSDKLRLNVWVGQGSSGSPVVDKNGRMVGLLRGVYSEEKPVMFEFREKEVVGSGVVFSKAEAPASSMAQAIPVEVVKSFVSDIKEKGKVQRGWLGISVAPTEEGKVEVVEVEKESPAELAKLQTGDIILEFEGKAVTSARMVQDEIRRRKPGDNVTLKIEREGKTMEIKAKLGEYSEEEAMREMENKFPQLFMPRPQRTPEPLRPPISPRAPTEPKLYRWGLEKRRYIGVYMQDINRELSEHFGVEKGKGVLIANIREGSPAEKARLKVGDVIVSADGVRVEAGEDLSKLIQDKKKGDKVKIEFLRDKKKMSVEVEVEEEETGRIPELNLPWDWRDYLDYWDDYAKDMKRQYQDWADDYSKAYQRQMEELKKQMKKMGEASKDLVIKIRSKAIRV